MTAKGLHKPAGRAFQEGRGAVPQWCWCSLLVLQSAFGWGQESELFEFFQEEAQVITASRRPQRREQAPATVYVIDAEQLRASGAQTLWEALRPVPGVEVMNVRTQYGAVSIRGLNKVLNNRTLVLVDGRPVLEGFTDNASWEALPVLLAEIERIEVVEGPASALYGANAINGVINIITQTPTQVEGNRVDYALGERQTHLGSLLHGGRWQGLDYKAGGEWRSTHRFEDPDLSASQVGKVHWMGQGRLGAEGRVSVDAGGVWLDTDLSLGGLGWGHQEGKRGFLRSDLVQGGTRLQFFWNGSRTRLQEFGFILGEPDLNYDTFDLNLQQTLALSPRYALVLGAELRRNEIDSPIIAAEQDLWAVFFEQEWRPGRRWTAWLSSRLDHHPEAGRVLSPRFSLLYEPVDQQVLRFSAGTSFRNPTLKENHLEILQQLELGEPFQTLALILVGNPRLEPERLLFAEVAYSGQLGRVKTTMAGFHYRLREVISVSEPIFASIEPNGLQVEATFVNQGETRAWGGELGGEFRISQQVSGYANYAWYDLSGELDGQVSAGDQPYHKINAGMRASFRRFRLGTGVHWVGETRWNTNQLYFARTTFLKVASYTLINLNVEYLFTGRLQQLELGFNAFNLLDNRHFETLPEQSTLAQGQGGEIIRARRTLKLGYRF